MGKDANQQPAAEQGKKNQRVKTTMCGTIAMRNATRSGPTRLFSTTDGETAPIAVGTGKRPTETQLGEWRYPWTAPRVIFRFFEFVAGNREPSIWIIDDYDGEEPWQERGATFPE